MEYAMFPNIIEYMLIKSIILTETHDSAVKSIICFYLQSCNVFIPRIELYTKYQVSLKAGA